MHHRTLHSAATKLYSTLDANYVAPYLVQPCRVLSLHTGVAGGALLCTALELPGVRLGAEAHARVLNSTLAEGVRENNYNISETVIEFVRSTFEDPIDIERKNARRADPGPPDARFV